MRKLVALMIVAVAALYGCTSPAPPEVPDVPTPPAPPAPPAHGAITESVQANVPAWTDPPWFKTVAFATPEHGWILFGNAPAIETRDGGATWQPAALPHPFERMSFHSPQVGLAGAGGATYRTADSGTTWQTVDTSGWPDRWAEFLDERHAWTLTDTLYTTADGGATWSRKTNPCPDEKNRPTSFVNPQTGWTLCGWDGAQGAMSKRLFRTDDGGMTWRLLGEALLGPKPGPEDDKEWPGGLSIADYSAGIDFVDERHGWWMGGRYGGLSATADGGKTWTRRSSPISAGFAHLIAFDDRNAYITGYGGASGGIAAVTRDGGGTWRQVYPTLRPRELFYLDAQTYIGVLESTLYRSPDGGRTWAELARFPAGEEPLNVVYTSLHQAWALTATGDHRKLYTSGDGGVTWVLASDSPQLDRMSWIHPVDARFAVLWDECRRLLVTRDGGASLQAAEPPYDDLCGHGFDMRSADAGWFSRSSLLHRTETGPGSWQVVPMQPQQKAQGVALTPDVKVWALIVDVSDTYTPVSMLLASTDEGKTWVRYDLGDFRGGSSLARCGLSSLCLGGGNGEIVSHDGGRTWAYRNK